MINLSLVELYLTLTAVEVPIPTDSLDFNDNLMGSPLDNWWAVDTETVLVIFSTLAICCVKLDSKEYFQSLASPFPVSLLPKLLK